MATYYVDATSGDDTKDGLSESNAWKTITKVNGVAFAAGDSVLFKRGETWGGTTLLPASSGTMSNPITFGAYGAGANPILDGQDTVDCVNGSGRNGLWFENIRATRGLDFGFNFNGSAYITLVDCEADHCGNDQLLIYNLSHDVLVSGGRFHDGYERVGGVLVTGIEIADGCYNVTISGAECYDQQAGVGMSIHAHAARRLPYRVLIEDCEFYGNASHGIQVNSESDTPGTQLDITIKSVTSHDNGTNGLSIQKGAGVSGYPDGILVDGCHSYDNAGNSYYLQADNLSVRRSVFDGAVYATACDGLKFHNNTIWLPSGAATYALYLTNARTDDVEVKNCIVYCQTLGGMAIGVNATVNAAAVDIDYNLYYLAAEAITAARWYWRGTAYGYADWLTNSSQDANSPAPANPLFESVPADDFRLQADSPAINTGTDLGLFYSGAAPDCGAYERWASRGATWLHLAGVHEED